MNLEVKFNLPKTLPRASEHGDYWLDGNVMRMGPVIMSCGAKSAAPGKFVASLGNLTEGCGVLFDGGKVRFFDTPGDALKALHVAKVVLDGLLGKW